MNPSRSDADPTRQAGNRRKAIADLKRRLNSAKREVLDVFSSVPVTNRVTYIYEIDPSQLLTVDDRIRQIINYWLETQSEDKPARYFFDAYGTRAATMGVGDSAARVAPQLEIAGFSTATLSQLEIENIIMGSAYRRVIELIHARAFNEMKGFVGDTARDLSRVLSQVVLDGRSPREAQRQIIKQFDQSVVRAERIARTEINRAYNVARNEQNKDVKNRLDINLVVAHRSALLPNGRTRKSHGERHGKMFTMQEQDDWWAEGANRINCYCGVIEVVLDKNGKPFDQGLIDKMEKQRKAWF